MEKDLQPFQKILVAHDGSENAWKALQVAIRIAKCSGAQLHCLSVEEDLPKYIATVGELEEIKRKKDEYFADLMRKSKELARNYGIELQPHIAVGHEVETIINFCKEEGFDLLVIGFMGHSKIFNRIWGSTSQNLTRLAPCHVLVIK